MWTLGIFLPSFYKNKLINEPFPPSSFLIDGLKALINSTGFKRMVTVSFAPNGLTTIAVSFFETTSTGTPVNLIL